MNSELTAVVTVSGATTPVWVMAADSWTHARKGLSNEHTVPIEAFSGRPRHL